MLLTLCTINQLPQAFALARSFCQHSALAKPLASGIPPTSTPPSDVLIGLADDPGNLPAGFTSPYPLVFLRDLLPADQLTALSNQYTPAEFVAACKPLFIADAFSRYPLVNQFLYADPNGLFFGDVAPIWSALSSANILLTPHVTHSPATGATPEKAGVNALRPAERHLQNVGLYSSDVMAFRRSDETRRMLAWWQDRVTERAYIDFCAGLCLDQLWLMHVPVFFRDVVVSKNPAWHVALWNLFNQPLRQSKTGWLVSSPARNGQPGTSLPLLFANFKGLHNPNEGLFTRQYQPLLSQRPDVRTLLDQYQTTLASQLLSGVQLPAPAHGRQAKPVVLWGWRNQAVQSLRAATDFLKRVPLPAVR